MRTVIDHGFSNLEVIGISMKASLEGRAKAKLGMNAGDLWGRNQSQ